MSHWSEQYLGEPWVAQEHDCWAFARRVWREQFGRHVPHVPFDATSPLACRRALVNEPERLQWEKVETPADGDAVLLSKSSRPSHVGVWADANGGAVVHCVGGAGVVVQNPQSLKLTGWNILGCYRRLPS